MALAPRGVRRLAGGRVTTLEAGSGRGARGHPADREERGELEDDRSRRRDKKSRSSDDAKGAAKTGAGIGIVLLIVGGLDAPVIDMNQEAKRQMRSETRLEIVPGATHLFEEPGTLDHVAALAREWFLRHL